MESKSSKPSMALPSRQVSLVDSLFISQLPETPWQFKSFLLGRIAFNNVLVGQFLALAFATGMADAITYGTYGVFSTKQSGNAIFLALWVFKHPAAVNNALMIRNFGVSIAAFFFGALFFGQMGRLVNQRRRIWLICANLLQTLLVFSAAGIRYSQHDNDKASDFNGWKVDTRPGALGILALLSFVFGGQISLAVSVRLAEVNTALIDVCLIQFTMDRHLLAWHNPDRNRRFLFLLFFVSGGFLGAVIIRYDRVATALLVVGGIKAAVTVTFFFNHGITRETLVDKEEDIEANAQTWRRLLSA